MPRVILNNRDKERIYRKCEGHCAYCGKEISLKQMQIDHYYPHHLSELLLKRFGILTEDLLNLLPCCRTCNHYKRSLLPENFRIRMQTLHERLSKIYINKVAESFGMINIKPFDGQFYFERKPTKFIIYPFYVNIVFHSELYD